MAKARAQTFGASVRDLQIRRNQQESQIRLGAHHAEAEELGSRKSLDLPNQAPQSVTPPAPLGGIQIVPTLLFQTIKEMEHMAAFDREDG